MEKTHIGNLINRCKTLKKDDPDFNSVVNLENMVMLISCIENLRLSLAEVEHECISVFGENGFPEFHQGKIVNELTDLVDAEMLNNITKTFVIPKLKEEGKL